MKPIIAVAVLLTLIIVLLAIVGYSFLYVAGRSVFMVTGESMMPTLNVGDVLVVQGGFTLHEVRAAYRTGDIICFTKPGDPSEVITHRAVEAHTLYLKTKGDNNHGLDPWEITDADLVGKVVEINSLPSIIFVDSIWLFVVIVTLIVISVLIYMRGGKAKTEKSQLSISPE